MVMTDHITGLVTAQAIGFALYRRTKTNVGELIEVPMFETTAAFVLREHLCSMTFDPPIGPIGDARVLDKNNRPARTADGYVSISPNTDVQAFAFFDAIGRPELKTDPLFCNVAVRTKNSEAYYQLRSTSLINKTSAEWIAIFEERDIPCMRYNSIEDLLVDPHLEEVGFIKKNQHPTEGNILELGLTNRFSGGQREDHYPAPRLGEHTFSVLREFGLTEDEIAAGVQSNALQG